MRPGLGLYNHGTADQDHQDIISLFDRVFQRGTQPRVASPRSLPARVGPLNFQCVETFQRSGPFSLCLAAKSLLQYGFGSGHHPKSCRPHLLRNIPCSSHPVTQIVIGCFLKTAWMGFFSLHLTAEFSMPILAPAPFWAVRGNRLSLRDARI